MLQAILKSNLQFSVFKTVYNSHSSGYYIFSYFHNKAIFLFLQHEIYDIRPTY